MIGLFNLSWNEELPLSRIETIRSHGTGDSTYRLKLTNDDYWYDLRPHAYRELASRPVQLLPANLPTEFVCWNDDGELDVWFEPVIGWALCFDGQVRPVTAGGVCNGSYSDRDDDYVRYPDGRIRAIGNTAYMVGFDDTDAFRTHLLDVRAIAAEHRAAAATATLSEGGEA
ncbi:hypothetical protein [Sphingomonas sp. Leaf4]|uniref:hypothetical protein n=1 Tax=Sphingomonas sp. Leaf4 TaxID=2876553 RepID=UPI001E4B8F80|nr:hypothetical protein [Sphingomonas sp. Leaf4]